MKVALHVARDRSEPGRLLGTTSVWGYDTDTRRPFELTEEIAHTITFTRKPTSGLERAIASELEALTQNTAQWALEGQMRTSDKDRTARFARFLREPEAYFSYDALETPLGVRYTLRIPNLLENQLRTIHLPLPKERRTAEQSARDEVLPYAILEPHVIEGPRRRTHRATGRLTREEIAGLPVFTFDLEVMNWQPIEPEVRDRSEAMEILESLSESFDEAAYAWMDLGLLRKHVRHAVNLERDERIYDAIARTPSGAYHSFTSLPVDAQTVETEFGIARITHRADQQAIVDSLAQLIESDRPAIITGHNHISYDQNAFKKLGAHIDIGADGRGVRTRFALPGSTIEHRALPDGNPSIEKHQAFLSDRYFRGIDNVDPAPWLRYVDELANTKLATVTRALTGRDVEKILSHDELEAIVQAHENPLNAEQILNRAGLSGDISTLLERERRYALNDAWFSALNYDEVTPTIAGLALVFDATMSEICTTTPEQHAKRIWDRDGRGERTRKAIRGYPGMKDRHTFTAEKALAYHQRSPFVSGRHHVILARRMSGRVLAETIDHPTLDELVHLQDSLEGFEKSWVERSIDAMLTEPLYALIASGDSLLEREANAWRLGLTRRTLDDLEKRISTIPNVSGAVASTNKHLYFPADAEGSAHVESLAREGWVEPLEEGVALVMKSSVIYEGSRRMSAGYLDPVSMRGSRNEFTKAFLPRIIDDVLEGDLEGSLRTLREAYDAFNEGAARITGTLRKDARDMSINARSAIIERARETDARKGDTVVRNESLDEARIRMFGFDGTPSSGLFSTVYTPSGNGLLCEPVLTALGIETKSERWNDLARYLVGEQKFSLEGSDL